MMFKDEYKKHFDEIHPSSQLIEQTKKRMLEEYQKISDSEDEKDGNVCDLKEETFSQAAEDNKKIRIRRRWITVGGTIAAGLAIATTGIYMSHSLKLDSDVSSGQVVLINTEEPVDNEEVKNNVKVKKEKAQNQQKVADSKKVKVKQSQTELRRIANMSRANGVTLDYASNDRVILHGEFGVMIYNLSARSIATCIPASEIYTNQSVENSIVKVNSAGNKIFLWSTSDSEDEGGEVKEYNIGTGEMTVWMQFDSKEEYFGNVLTVSGSEADVYTDAASNGQMVMLGDGRYVQLMYQVPQLDKQASLTISIVDVSNKTEQLIGVFGTLGKEICLQNGYDFEGYHNENGKQLFEKKETNEDKPKEDSEPAEEIIVTEEPKVTEEPQITEEPKPTEIIETEEPTVDS